MPFPFLPSLFSDAYSPLPCTIFVVLPFFGVFQWHCWQQEELWTAWISRSFMGNCNGGESTLGTCNAADVHLTDGTEVCKETLLQGERGVKTHSYSGSMLAHFLLVRRAWNGAVWVAYSSFPCKDHISWVIFRRFSAWGLLLKHSECKLSL